MKRGRSSKQKKEENNSLPFYYYISAILLHQQINKEFSAFQLYYVHVWVEWCQAAAASVLICENNEKMNKTEMHTREKHTFSTNTVFYQFVRTNKPLCLSCECVSCMHERTNKCRVVYVTLAHTLTHKRTHTSTSCLYARCDNKFFMSRDL